MEALEEVWKALGHEAWNILTLIHRKRSILQLVLVGMTFSTALFPKRANKHRSMFVQTGTRVEAPALTHTQVGS